MELSRYLDDVTVAALTRVLPGVPLEPKLTPVSGSSKPYVSVKLPPAPGAEYRFSLALLPERQILAELLSISGQHYFWYRPFEDADFRNLEELDQAFFETLELLVSHETRIVQKRGMFAHSFRCDYDSAGRWKRVYAHSALRFGNFRIPAITGKERIYYSPALLPRSSR